VSYLERAKTTLANHPFFFTALFFFLFGTTLTHLSLSRQVKVFLATLLLGSAIAYFPSKRLVDWIYNQPRILLFEIKAEKDEVKLWEFTPRLWEKVEVTEGSLHTVSTKKGEAYVCNKFIPTKNEAIGTWIGSANDLELIQEREKIEEVRNRLEDLAKQGLRTRIQVSSIVREAVNKIISKLAVSLEKEVVYNGEQIQESIDQALKEINLQKPDEKKQKQNKEKEVEIKD